MALNVQAECLISEIFPFLTGIERKQRQLHWVQIVEWCDERNQVEVVFRKHGVSLCFIDCDVFFRCSAKTFGFNRRHMRRHSMSRKRIDLKIFLEPTTTLQEIFRSRTPSRQKAVSDSQFVPCDARYPLYCWRNVCKSINSQPTQPCSIQQIRAATTVPLSKP